MVGQDIGDDFHHEQAAKVLLKLPLADSNAIGSHLSNLERYLFTSVADIFSAGSSKAI